jgi:hypothetical protein
VAASRSKLSQKGANRDPHAPDACQTTHLVRIDGDALERHTIRVRDTADRSLNHAARHLNLSPIRTVQGQSA